MALIQCPSCGNMVSDNASVCIKCGAPIIRKIRCKDCDTEYAGNLAYCPNCGCPSPSSQQAYQTGPNPGYAAGMYGQPNTPPPPYMNKEQRVQRFLMTNAKFFPPIRIEEIRNNLLQLSDQQLNSIECIPFKDPMILLLISIFLGTLDVDRFMLGEVGTGVAKLITCILCVGIIWWLIDIFLISEKTQEYNYNQLRMSLNYM